MPSPTSRVFDDESIVPMRPSGDADCSSGGIEGPLTLSVVPRVPGYHVPFAERIRHEADVPTMAVGLITDPRKAEAYLSEGRCDLIALARELMWNPNWPVHAAETLGGTDPLALLPPSYAWWLRRRREVCELRAVADTPVQSTE